MSTTRTTKILSTVLLAGLAVSALAGCSSSNDSSAGSKGCAPVASSPEAAMKGLIDAAGSSKAVDDACKYVDADFGYTASDLSALKSNFPGTSDKSSYKVNSQSGSKAQLSVTNADLSSTSTYALVKGSNGKWAVDFGTKK